MTVNNDDRRPPGQSDQAIRRRPLWISFLCFFSWTYYGILCLLFLLAIFWSRWIGAVMMQYVPEQSMPRGMITLMFAGLFLFHSLAFSGIVLLWKQRPAGYILFSVPAILISLFFLFRPEISWLPLAICTIQVILFGIFYRDLRRTG